MGQKVDPRGLRTGPTLNKDWESVFFASNNYRHFLIQDINVRSLIKKKFVSAQISSVKIERPSDKKLVANIYAKRPGVIIGKSGQDIESLKNEITSITSSEVYINIVEVKKPEIDANIIAHNIVLQIEKRVSYKKAMKRAIQTAMKQGAKGIRVNCAGRLGGAEIARTEWYKEGRIPLHTLRADIDYATARANTTYGVIGVKVWVYRGDATSSKKRKLEQ